MKRLIITLAVGLLYLTACSPDKPADPTLTAPATLASASDPLNLFATQTQSAARVGTAEAQQKASTTPIPILSPSPLPAITQVLEEVGPFRQVSRQEALILGKVLELQPIEDGFLLFSEGGISYFKDDRWTGHILQGMSYPLGADSSGRAWSVSSDGLNISQSLKPLNSHLDPSDDMEIWITYRSEEGWSPVTDFTGSPVKYGLVEGSRGDLWFTTQQDVRVFDNAWQAYDSTSLGMPESAGDTVSEFTIYPIENNGEVYAGRCDWGSTGPAGGGGWRVFDGQARSEPEPLLNAGCVTAFAQDSAGGTWIAQDANLWYFTPETALLQQASLPLPPAPYRFGYINSLTTAPDGSLWAQMALCSEGACFGGEAIYRLQNGTWQQIGEPSPAGGQRLLFDAAGTGWLLSAGSIHQVIGTQLQPVPGLVVQAAAVDEHGVLWLVAQSSGPPTLWMQH